MGAGLSQELRYNILGDVIPQRDAPMDVEQEARRLTKNAHVLAQIHPPAHEANYEAAPAETRPAWLDLSQLHAALLGEEHLIESLLSALQEVAPLLEVQGDPIDGDAGPLNAATKAGLQCHTFMDTELRSLRLWAPKDTSSQPMLGSSSSIPGLRFLDVVVLLVDKHAEAGSANIGENAHINECNSAVAKRDAAKMKVEQLKAELNHLHAEKQAAIDAEDFDAAHAAKRRTRAVATELNAVEVELEEADAAISEAAKDETDANTARESQRTALEQELHQLRAQLLALTQKTAFDEDQRKQWREELQQTLAQKQDAVNSEDFEAAHVCQEKEKALLSKLHPQRCKTAPKSKEQQLLEENLKRVTANKLAAIDAEEFEKARQFKSQERKLMAELQQLPIATASEDHSRKQDLEQELQEIISRLKELDECNELLEKEQKTQRDKLEELRLSKAAAIEDEDFDAAHIAKVQEKQVLLKLEEGNTEVEMNQQERCEAEQRMKSIRQELEGECCLQPKQEDEVQALRAQLAEVTHKKQDAIDSEDYDLAHCLKLQAHNLNERLDCLVRNQPEEEEERQSGDIERLALQEELDSMQRKKQEAIDSENYDEAHIIKQRENHLKNKLAALAQDAKCGRNEINLQRQKLEQRIKNLEVQLQELLNVEDRGDGPDVLSPVSRASQGGWEEKLAKLICDPLPPLVVFGVGAIPTGLQNATSNLSPHALLEMPDAGDKSWCDLPRFWDLLRSVLQAIDDSRNFPAEMPERDLGDGLYLGDCVQIQQGMRRQPDNKLAPAELGVLNNYWTDGTWHEEFCVRTYNGASIKPPREKLSVLSLEPWVELSTIVELVCMDMWWVRLRDLKGRSDLNRQEGFATMFAVQQRESGFDSIYDAPPRHTVMLPDGSTVRVKLENFEILEEERSHLQGCLGLLDARDELSQRFQVLVVRHGKSGPVTIKGLEKQPHLNGARGTVVGYNDEVHRFIVQLDDMPEGKGEIRVKEENLIFDIPKTVACQVVVRPQCIAVSGEDGTEKEGEQS